MRFVERKMLFCHIMCSMPIDWNLSHVLTGRQEGLELEVEVDDANG